MPSILYILVSLKRQVNVCMVEPRYVKYIQIHLRSRCTVHCDFLQSAAAVLKTLFGEHTHRTRP